MPDDRTQLLVIARSAYRRHDWRTSYESFSRVDEVQSLDTDDLAVYASVAWRQGHGREAVRINEQVHTRLLRTDPMLAAMKAAELGLAWLARGHSAPAVTWAQRAGALLDGMPAGPALGYLTYLLAVIAADSGDNGRCVAAARQLTRIASDLDDAALAVSAVALDGMAAVTAGDPAGWRTLDRILLPVLDERVPVEWAGDIYRRALQLARRSGATDRLRSWTESMQRWCDATEPEGDQSAYRAVCDVHRLATTGAQPDIVRTAIALRRMVADVDAVAAGLLEDLVAQRFGQVLRPAR